MELLPRVFDILMQSDTLACIRLSFSTACVVMPMLTVCGVALGYLLGRRQGQWISVIDFFVTLPLIFPPIATGFLLLMLLGRRSMLGTFLHNVFGLEIIFSFWSIVLASFIAGMPLIVKQVQAAIRGETNRLIEASYVLGKTPATTFFRVVLPSIRKSIAIGLSLAFARSLGEVGITLMLGGNISGRTSTISLEVYNAVFTGEYHRAFVLVFLLVTITLLLICLTRRLAKEE